MPDTQTRFDLEKIQRMNLLYDFYGELLTPKQSAYLTMYYMDDLSLGEIAKHNGITPQAAADLIKRTGALLEQYEKKLGLIQKHAGKREKARQITDALKMLEGDVTIKELVGHLVGELAEI